MHARLEPLPHPLQPLLSRALALAGLAALALALGALHAPYALAAVVSVLLVVLALTRPIGVLYVLLLSVPFASLAQIDAGDFTISSTEGLVALLMLGWLLGSAIRRDLRVEGGLLLVPMLWVLGVMLLSTPQAEKLSLAAKESLKWLELIAVFLFVAWHVRTWSTAQRVLIVLLLAGVAEAVYAIVQVALGSGPASFAVGSLVRAHGTFGQPNPFGGYLGTLLPLVGVLALTLRTRKQRLLALAGIGILGLAFLASQSRGAWIGFAAALLVALVLWSPASRRFLLPTLYAGAVVVVLGLAGVLPAAVVDRLGVAAEYFGVFDVRDVPLTPENWAVVERMAHWQAGWEMFKDHPLLGVGPGNYPAAYERYFLPGWLDPLGHAHNYYLNLAAEIGLAGLLGVLALLALSARRALEVVRGLSAGVARPRPGAQSDAESWRTLAMGLLASLVVFLLHSFFDNLLVHGMTVQLGAILGLVYVAHSRGLRGTNEEPNHGANAPTPGGGDQAS